MFRRLLVPVDFEACSVQALRHACTLTRVLGGSLTVLHVLDGRVGEADAGDKLRALAAGARRPAAVRVYPEVGGIAQTILQAARDEGADLLIVGTHGRSDLGAGVLGGVVHELVLRAHLPVQLVPEGLREAPARSRWLVEDAL